MESSTKKSVLSEAADLSPKYVSQRYKGGNNDWLKKQFSDFKEDIMKFMTTSLSKQEEDLKHVTTTLKQISQTNNNIETSIMYLTAQNEEFQKKIDFLQSQIKEHKSHIIFLENKIEEFENNTRKMNIMIKNVPKRNSETKQDLIDMVMCLSQSIDCKMSESDIKDIYRIRGRNSEQQNHTSVVIQTSSAILKTEILKKCKIFNVKNKSKLRCKHLGFGNHGEVPVFLSEHLTTKGSRLYFLARDLVRTQSYKFCWTAFGKVYVRKDETAPIITIRSEDQVQKLQTGT